MANSADPTMVVEERISTFRQRLEDEHVSTPIQLKRLSLTEVPPSLLRLDYVTCLYLEGNKLTSLPEDFFFRLSTINWLDLRNNELTSLPVSPDGYRDSSLHNLLLENNKLTDLPNGLGEVSGLMGLSLSRNPLQYPPPAVVGMGVKAIVEFLYKALHHIHDDLLSAQPVSLPPIRRSGNRKGKSKTAVATCKVTKLPSATPRSGQQQLLSAQGQVGGQQRPISTAELYQHYQQQQQAQNALRNLPISQASAYVTVSNDVQSRAEQHKQALLHRQQLSNMPANMSTTAKKVGLSADRQVEASAAAKSLLEQANDAKRKQQETELVLQQRKDKQTLSSWRQKRKDEQRRLDYSRRTRTKPALPQVPKKPAPYATDGDVTGEPTQNAKLAASLQKISKPGSSLAKTSAHQESREKQLQDRIQRHIEKMRLRDEQILSPRSKVEAARKDLEQALQHRDELAKRTAAEPEYRLSAFIATLDEKNLPPAPDP